MSQIKEDIMESKRVAKIAKKSNIRDIINLKSLMDKRKQQRASTIYNIANGKFQNALIIARQLLFTSMKIWKEFNDDYIEQFEQNFFFKTSKCKEHTEYLLDSTIICKVYIKSKKKDDILDIIEKLEIPEVKIVQRSELVNKQMVQKYNEMKEILARTCASLLSFIEVTKHEKLNQYTERLFHEYINFVKAYYGPLQYATATFLFANYLYEAQQYQKSLEMHNICLSIRKKNCLNEAFVDVLVNSSICMRELGKIREAIERMTSAIEISKDLKKNQETMVDDYHLFLAKLQLQNADFHQAYKNYQITYKLRESLSSQDPRKIQIQVNLLYFYKMLQKCAGENYEQCFNIKDRKELQTKRKIANEISKDMILNIFNREQFTKFDDFNKKMAHLNLVVTEAFFDLLSADQVIELNSLMQKLGSCSFQKGVNQLFKCSFLDEKKTRELLLQANPLIESSKGALNQP